MFSQNNFINIKTLNIFRIINIIFLKFLIAIFFTIYLCESYAQTTYRVKVIIKDRPSTENIKELKFKDSSAISHYINQRINSFQKNGFLLASLDTNYIDSNTYHFVIYKGDLFNSAKIKIAPEDLYFLRKKARLTEKYLANFPFTPSEITTLKTSIQKSLEDNGYPFASVSLDSLGFNGATLKANLSIHKGPKIEWTKINIRGDRSISEKLISSYIQIKPGDLFNQETLDLISNRLSLLPFVQEIKPAEVLFTPWGAELYLYLATKKVSTADGIIGLQPKSNGGYTITGDLKLKLINELKRAETFSLNWKSLQYQTQSLDILLNIPNLFRTRFGFDGNFNLYKRDSSFLDIKFQIGIQYALNNGSYLKFYYRNENSSVLKGGQNNPTFNRLGNSKVNYYGLNLVKNTVNYLPNPSKGYQLFIDFSLGQRKTKLPDSTNFDKSLTYKIQFNYQQFITLHKRNVMRLGLLGSYLGAPNYFDNELFRFGGQMTQRGFNEEQFFATAFSTSSIEYRFLVDQNSYAFAFYDQSFYQNKNDLNFYDFPFGFGAGFTFGTKIGSFSISYALGKQKGTEISLKNGKIHFGYIAYF